MNTLYGIKNCDTVKKARNWLDQKGIVYQFHDFRADGLEMAVLHDWFIQIDWQSLLNRRGTTWRKLPEEMRESLDSSRALQLMLEQPTLIKRPILTRPDQIHIGFSEKIYSSLFDD